MASKAYTFDRVIRLLISLSILLLFLWLLQRLSNVLLPFLTAWLLAYLLQPIVRFFQLTLKIRSRIVAISLTLVVCLAVFVGTLMLLSPLIIKELAKFYQLILTYKNEFNVDKFLPKTWQLDISNYFSHLDLQSILRDENIMTGAKNIAPQLWNIINGSLEFILGLATLIIVFLYTVFILLDYERIAYGWLEIIPKKQRPLISEIVRDLEIGMNRYFRGQAVIALLVAILFMIGFSIIQLPLAIVLGLLIGLLNLVPYLKVIGLIPTAIMGLLQSSETGQNYGSVLLGIAIVFISIQLIEDLFITPKIMGKVTGLNPAVILLSLSIWGSLLGIVGMIIALPMTTLIISYYKRFVLKETSAKPEVEMIEELQKVESFE
jgi:predicted PurR-regulated permease PerM